jgi:cytochrome c peroxidase
MIYRNWKRSCIHLIAQLTQTLNCSVPTCGNDATDTGCDDLQYVIYDEHQTLDTFRTPILGNVSKTGPYMHGGQHQALKDTVKHYVNRPPLK